MSTNDVLPERTHTKNLDGADDVYDHAISLVDTTLPQDPDVQPRTRSSSPSSRKLTKKPTKGSVREQLTRRKYAKWQENRYSSKTDSIRTDESEAAGSPVPQTNGKHGDISETEATDFAPRTEDRGRKQQEGEGNKKRNSRESHIDILYENQRGWFFFGIPLYSHSSLLNFDPGPWITKDFKDSAVNITNAQVPDPSWVWTWKNWYVDMSYDVDEEGWQYSFSFGPRWAWHGTHPWFHSYVRRRRWLRKREKRYDAMIVEKGTGIGAAHHLTGDYFTIHPMRERSPASLEDENRTARPSSYISIRAALEEGELLDDIKNIPNLLKVMRIAKIDREKIDAIKKFLDQGGEELAYLGEKMPDIMSFLVFQNSRRQLLSVLKREADKAQEHRNQHNAEDTEESAAESCRINNLLAAIESADGEIQGLEYWNDQAHALRIADDTNGNTHTGRSAATGLNEHSADSIRGISDKAEVDVEHPSLPPSPTPDEPRKEDKGKGKEIAQTDGGSEARRDEEEDAPARLGYDSVFIPD